MFAGYQDFSLCLCVCVESLLQLPHSMSWSLLHVMISSAWKLISSLIVFFFLLKWFETCLSLDLKSNLPLRRYFLRRSLGTTLIFTDQALESNSKQNLFSFVFRSALKLGCGVFVYVVTWILLGQNSEETVDESAQKQFTVRAHSFRRVMNLRSFSFFFFSFVYFFSLLFSSSTSKI